MLLKNLSENSKEKVVHLPKVPNMRLIKFKVPNYFIIILSKLQVSDIIILKYFSLRVRELVKILKNNFIKHYL